jgi:hypothetical protein
MAYDFSDWFAPTALSVSIASGDTTIQVDTPLLNMENAL